MRIRIKRKLSGAYVSCQTERLPAALNRPNHAAADFGSGITRGLGSEVVSVGVQYDRAPYDIVDGKTLVIEGSPGIALIGQQRRQIACMEGMRPGSGIIVVAGMLE